MNERKIGVFNKKRLKGNNLTRSEGSSCGDPGNCEQVEQNLERVAVHVYQHPQSTHRLNWILFIYYKNLLALCNTSFWSMQSTFQRINNESLKDVQKATITCTLIHKGSPQRVAPHIWFSRLLRQMPFSTQTPRDLCLLLGPEQGFFTC